MCDSLEARRCWLTRPFCEGRPPPKMEKVLPKPDLLPEKALWSFEMMDSFLGMEGRWLMVDLQEIIGTGET